MTNRTFKDCSGALPWPAASPGPFGNRIALGLVGRLAFALASATIAFTDQSDSLFPVGSLIGIWAVAVGVVAMARKA
jgi:hypothetical protein